MALLLPQQRGINYRQPEIVHVLIYREPRWWVFAYLFCTLMQLILKMLRVENENTQIVGPALIDTVVLFKVC